MLFNMENELAVSISMLLYCVEVNGVFAVELMLIEGVMKLLLQKLVALNSEAITPTAICVPIKASILRVW